MSELDFDELDKAVNTLMSDVPRAEPPKTDDVKTLNITPTLSDASRPSLAQLDSALSEANGSTSPPAPFQKPAALTTPPPSLATRRTGRFMDVVHPSSNMKSGLRRAAPASRQGVFVQPDEKLLTAMSADQSDVIQAVDLTTPAADTDIIQNSSSEPIPASPSETKNEWPDPLEMSGYETEPNVSAVVEVPEEVSPSPSELSLVEESDDDDDIFTIDGLDERDLQPTNSPFIADAKVEKRPLGGTPVDETSEELGRAPVLGVLVTDTAASTDPSDQLPASPVSLETQLPPELQSDLMAIETDGGTATAALNDIKTADETVVQQPVAVSETPASPTAEAVTLESSVVVTPAIASGPTSIPQQYHEEQSTSDQSNGSIYDTDSYHQPLAHPAKAKSGWLWVVWILLLVVVGGGGAGALYFLGII
jgi:hypothetical protein